MVGAGPDRLRGTAALLARGEGDGPMSHAHVAATVAGLGVPVADVDAREAGCGTRCPLPSLPRRGHQRGQAAAPLADTASGDRAGDRGRGRRRRCHRRWRADGRRTAARTIRRGWRSAASRRRRWPTRSPGRCSPTSRPASTSPTPMSPTTTLATRCASPRRRATGNGWRTATVDAPPLDAVRPLIAEHLRGAARRRAFRLWLDARRAELVRLAPGYEHPGDPRQPDNTHRH